MRTVKPKGPTAAELVEAMREAGAAFIFTECGSLLVRGLNSLPAEITARFFESEPREMVAAVRLTQQKPPSGAPATRQRSDRQ
ncbi:MAG: hypothetical protein ACKVX9_08895 [Blastocatellia bacterium]